MVGSGDDAGYVSMPGGLLILIIVRQGSTVLAAGAGVRGGWGWGSCLDIFSLAWHIFYLTPSVLLRDDSVDNAILFQRTVKTKTIKASITFCLQLPLKSCPLSKFQHH